MTPDPRDIENSPRPCSYYDPITLLRCLEVSITSPDKPARCRKHELAHLNRSKSQNRASGRCRCGEPVMAGRSPKSRRPWRVCASCHKRDKAEEKRARTRRLERDGLGPRLRRREELRIERERKAQAKQEAIRKEIEAEPPPPTPEKPRKRLQELIRAGTPFDEWPEDLMWVALAELKCGAFSNAARRAREAAGLPQQRPMLIVKG